MRYMLVSKCFNLVKRLNVCFKLHISQHFVHYIRLYWDFSPSVIYIYIFYVLLFLYNIDDARGERAPEQQITKRRRSVIYQSLLLLYLNFSIHKKSLNFFKKKLNLLNFSLLLTFPTTTTKIKECMLCSYFLNTWIYSTLTFSHFQKN